MTSDEVRMLFERINVWKRGDQRAPHKPLLLLYALGRIARGEPRLVSFREVDEALRPLLEEFGPSRTTYHTEYPFWRLQNDGIWEVTGVDKLERRRSNTDAKKSELLKHNVSGGFSSDVHEAISEDKSLVADLVSTLLEKYFPNSYHDDIIDAAGLEDLNAL